MELVKKNVHMDRLKSKAVMQVTLDNDVNVPDSKPDVQKLIFDKGNIKIEESKLSGDFVNVKGKLLYDVLYLTEEEEERVYAVQGSEPFEEKLHLEGGCGTDHVQIKWDIEDLSISLINSRKLNIQSVITLLASIEELVDEETSVDIISSEPIEYCKKTLDISEIAVLKKDVFRIREEIELPSNLPNVFEILWEDIRIGEIDFKALEEKISLQGEVHVFVLYEGEGEERPNRWYETMLPFSGVIECHGCKESMTPDICFEIGHLEMEVRPDFDGEERMLGLDIVLDLSMKLYEEEKVEVLDDVYGVTKEIMPISKEAVYRSLLIRNTSKCRVSERIKIKNSGARILQLCHSEGDIKIGDTNILKNGIEICGTILVKVLYVTNDDKLPFYSVKGEIPFTCMIEVADIDEQCSYHIIPCMEQLNVVMIDSEEIEAKAVVSMHAIVFSNKNESIITDIRTSELDMDRLKDLPSIVGYVAKDGDNVWQLGKKYYLPVRKIMEMNHLTSSELQRGDKILIVKTMESEE